MIPLSATAELAALASAAYLVMMNRATPCHLREKILNFIKDVKADLPAEVLRDLEAEEVQAVIKAMAYFL